MHEYQVLLHFCFQQNNNTPHSKTKHRDLSPFVSTVLPYFLGVFVIGLLCWVTVTAGVSYFFGK